MALENVSQRLCCRTRIWKAVALASFHITRTHKKSVFGPAARFLRKGAEATLVPVAGIVSASRAHPGDLPERSRMGPGIYGAESACRLLRRSPGQVYRPPRGARLAAILRGPLKRRPERMNNYSAIIFSAWPKSVVIPANILPMLLS